MPTGFNIGPVTIRFYSLLIILGAIVGAWLAAWRAKKQGHDPEIVLDLLPWLLIGGIIGARLWHVFTPSASNQAMGITTENYLRNPIEILKMWNGGLGIPGGVIGGALALLIYAKVKKLSFLQWADFIAPGLLIGQAIGRWGNFINQEVYGMPSNLPWAIKIDLQHRIPGFEHLERYHPLFLYESLLNLIGAGVLLWVDKKFQKKLFRGDLFFGYLIWYSAVRFGLEFLRLDPSPVNGINVNQTSMLVVGLLTAVLLVLRHTVWAEKLAEKERTAALLVEAPEDDVHPEDAVVVAEGGGTLLDIDAEITETDDEIEPSIEIIDEEIEAAFEELDAEELPDFDEEDLPTLDGGHPDDEIIDEEEDQNQG